MAGSAKLHRSGLVGRSGAIWIVCRCRLGLFAKHRCGVADKVLVVVIKLKRFPYVRAAWSSEKVHLGNG
jgi:hypothetical protein